MTDKTQTIGGPFITRRKARRLERCIQSAIDAGGGYVGEDAIFYTACGLSVPRWAGGVRVEKAGHFQYTVVATTARGH